MIYEFAEDLQKEAEEISKTFFPYIKIESVKCFRSYGTSSRRTIARCHTIGKLIQKALNIKAIYVLEFLSERFDKLSKEEKTKTIIHELMHIPKSFGGGFKHHDFVCDRNINKCYRDYMRIKEQTESLKNRQAVLETEHANKNQQEIF